MKVKYISFYIIIGKCFLFYDVNVRYLNIEGIWMVLLFIYFVIVFWGNILFN